MPAREPGRADPGRSRAARRSACVLRTARPAARLSAAAVARACVRGDEEGDVMMAVAELDLQLDAFEERRRRVEDDPVGAGVSVAELWDAAVVVRNPLADEVAVGVEELDTHAC